MSIKRPRRTAEITAHIVCCVQAAPCQMKVIMLAAGLDPRKTESVRPHLDALRGMGLIYIHSWNKGRPLYSWQTAPWALADVPKPPAKDPRVRVRVNLKMLVRARSLQQKLADAADYPNRIMRPVGTWEKKAPAV